MEKLKDRTFIITSGTSDIGRALTLCLSSYGADIAILDKGAEKGRRIIDEISDNREVKEHHGRAAFFETDLTKKDSIKEGVSRAAETFGAIDVLVSAMQYFPASSISSAEYLANFDKLIDLNMKSAIYATQAVVPFMRGRKRGKIIYVVSDLIRLGQEGDSLSALTRGSLIYYAKSLARELGPSNICVNCVATGPTEDYFLTHDPQAGSIKKSEEKFLPHLPLGRSLKAPEIAEVISFLASSKADSVTGQTWAVNCGLTML